MPSIPEAEILQKQLALQISEKDEFQLADLKTIAGCDVEYDKDSDTIAGAIAVLDLHTRQVIEYATHVMKATFPYVPGLFSFREMPPVLEAFRKLNIKPDLIVCDGQGISHPRRFGFACHLGIELNIPTIGCAKTRLFGHYEEPKPERGSSSDLIGDNNECVGKVLRTQTGINPLFVSVGHKVSLGTATQLILGLCTEYRLPETTRLADHYGREAMLEYKRNNSETSSS